MADELTIEEYEQKRAELEAMQKELEAKGLEILSPNAKPLYKSKIFWANIVALGVMLVQHIFGYAVSPEELGVVLGIVNIGLRYLNPDISGVVN